MGGATSAAESGKVDFSKRYRRSWPSRRGGINRGVVGLSTVLALVFFLPEASFSQSLLAPAQNPLAGSRVFGEKGCGKCHSVNGVGGKIGPDLGRIPQGRSFNDLAAAMWNHLPQMASRMAKENIPPPHLAPREIGDLIAFLFTLNYFDSTGDPTVGKKLFAEKRCVVCHQIRGVGGVIGPSLDAVGQSGSPIHFASAMWNHGPAMSEAMRALGIKRPQLLSSELRHLIAYLKSAGPQPAGGPISVLPGRVDEGRALFETKQCAECHSVKGKGGKVGPDLGRRGIHRNLFEFAAALWNKAPAMLKAIREKAIPVPQIEAEEMADIVAYLRSVQYFDEPGNPVRGRKLLSEKQCLSCHSFQGKGGNTAPDLAGTKGLDSPATITAVLWNHLAVLQQRYPEQAPSWPAIRSEEMSHLTAFFQEQGRSKR